MALQPVLLSYTIEDDKGKRASCPVYGVFDDATATIASLLAYNSATVSELDAITEGKIISGSMTLYPTLPVGLKASPVANSDVEESGLLTFVTSAYGKAYGQDVPAFIQTAFVDEAIDETDVAVAAWVSRMITSGTIIHSNNFFQATLSSLRKGRKSFRKRR
ncbi:MAG: hypothetical protein HBSAPP04_27210 [Ignavibacteriaceae bacterium]|nr:MAG: hypothetical protein HBSAPP04_27210 [Ignavibacteriaceae bacterium]